MEIVSLSREIIQNFKEYVKKLTDFNQYMDQVYSNVGQYLPQLEREIRYEVDEAKTMLDYLISGNQGSGVIDSIQEIAKTLKENTLRVEEYIQKYRSISKTVIERLESLVKLNKMIKKMQQLSKEIKIFSVNSVIISSRAGKEGVGFKSISHFIIELSDEINHSAAQLENFNKTMMRSYAKIKERFSYLFDEIYNKKMYQNNQDIQEKIENGVKSVEEIYSLLNDMLKRIEKPVSMIPTVMTNLQNQDITRQAIEHMIEIFEQVIEESKNSETKKIKDAEIFFCVYVSYVIDKIRQDLNHTNTLIDTTNNRIKQNFRSIYEIFMDIEQDKKEIVDYLLENSYSQEKQGILKAIFDELKEVFKNYESILEEELRIKSEIKELFSELEKNYQEGTNYFAIFKKFYDKMNNINILAQIEINKKEFAGKNSSAIRSKFYGMLNYLFQFKEEIKSDIEDNFKALVEELKSFSRKQQEEEGFINENINFLNKNFKEMESFYLTIHESLSSVLSSGQKIIQMVRENSQKMNILDEMVQKIHQLKDTIQNTMENFNKTLHSFLEENKLSYDDFLKNNEFIERIKRSTVNLEKHIAESGEVELF